VSIHPKTLPKFRKQSNLSKVTIEIEIKNENGRVTWVLACVGLS
jgi:hypothetical protein